MGEVSSWIPTTFAGSTEGEADSLNSLPSDPPAPVVTEPLSDDLSFDLISRHKLSLTPRGAGTSTQERLSPKGAGITLFEEDTRSSWSVDSSKTTPVKEAVADEDSNSVSSQKSAVKRPHSDDEANAAVLFPPENLFEYMWPQEKGEFYILQEQISDYLSIKSFKRKYPDLQRRTADVEEKKFLLDKGVVTETQCELGLTALKSEDVMELMNKDYPDKYNEYIKVLREKEKQTLTEKHKEYANAVDRNKIIDVAKKAVKSAAEYNAHLNQERKEERRCCLDLQTFTVHYPISRNKKIDRPKTGKYPVALLPGQYQDGYKNYTPEQLKFLPLNTVLYGPLKELNSVIQSDGSDSEDSTGSDGSCSSSQGTHDDNSGESSSSSEKNEKASASGNSNDKLTLKNALSKAGKEKSGICKVCKLGSGTGKEDKNEPLVQCSECKNSGHPTCLELTLDMVPVLKTYQWQCMDCKICAHCRDPYDEDKMLFCDICDRGYHTFCVGLKSLPQGKWICPTCGRCSICGASCAGPDGSKAQWQYDSVASSSQNSETSRRQVVCTPCSKRKR